MSHRPLTLVGDGIENPWNARTLLAAAEMFGAACLFRDRAGLADTWREESFAERDLAFITPDDLGRDFAPRVALDNLSGAASIYGFTLGAGPRPAIIAGNERRGIAADMQAIATQAVQIPLVSRRLNSLNVAAAAAVALYYLGRGGGAPLQVRRQPEQRRPEVALVGAADHVELGSSIRSAGAFGWQRLLVDDRDGAWFGRERAVIAEGRAAARRQRNPIHILPSPSDRRYAFDHACVISVRQPGLPLHRAALAGGPSQVVIIPDERATDLARERWERFAPRVEIVHLPLPAPEHAYHFRLVATIALAEIARQVGRRAQPGVGRPRPPAPFYDRRLEVVSQMAGETVHLDELERY
jgi:hypothetical protein